MHEPSWPKSGVTVHNPPRAGPEVGSFQKRRFNALKGKGYSIGMQGSFCHWNVLVLIGGLTLSCCVPAPRPQPQTNESSSDKRDKTILVPQFTVSISLSNEAKNLLLRLHESVLVIAYFDGDPLPGQGRYNAPMRGIVLGQGQKLVDAKGEATFDTTKISKSNWDRLSNKDYFVTINIVSARTTSKDNLLDCGAPENRISAFAGKTTNVSCSLISEPQVRASH